MASDNQEPRRPIDETSEAPESNLSSKDIYNVVSDNVAGLNVRKSDNKFQAIFILISVVLLAAIGSVAAIVMKSWELPWFGGAIFGGFAGLLIGFFASGIFLMIYRTVRHIKGHHD